MMTVDICSFNACSNIRKSRGYCVGHYTQFLRDPNRLYTLSAALPAQCEFSNCNRKRISRSGHCKTHYAQEKSGKTLMPISDLVGYFTEQELLDNTSLSPSDRGKIFRQRLSKIKLSEGCLDCGYKDHPEALQFDHLPQFTKLFKISDGKGRTWNSVAEEISKCEVVCANCHAVRTANRRSASALEVA